MKPYDFDYVRVSAIDEVFELLEEHGDDAKILAGGQSLMATLNMRLSAPGVLIDINDLAELRSISLTDSHLRVGALARHVDVQDSDDIARHVPLLALAMPHVAHPAIRNRGTHGGSIAFADPAAEIPACAVALDACLLLASRARERRVAARDFFQDLYQTGLEENEILTAIEYPLASPAQVARFYEFARRKGDFATVGLALSGEKADGILKKLDLVFFGIANTPVLATETAGALVGQALSPDLLHSAKATLAGEIEVLGDYYTSSAMKIHLAGHYLDLAIQELMNEP